MIFERVRPEEVTTEDIRWLHVGCLECKWDDRYTPVKLVEKAVKNEVVLYRLIDNRCRGIVVLSFDFERSWLWIEMFAGRGLIKVQQEFRTMLAAMAEGMGLKRIAGFVSRRALANWYDKHTQGKPVAVLYLEETSDVRLQASDKNNRLNEQQESVRPSTVVLSGCLR